MAEEMLRTLLNKKEVCVDETQTSYIEYSDLLLGRVVGYILFEFILLRVVRYFL